MSSRTITSSVTFAHPFVVGDATGELPPGIYQVVAEEDLIESLSFVAYRRTATHLLIEGVTGRKLSQLLPVDHRDLEAALAKDQDRSSTFEQRAAALSPPEDLI